MNTNDVDKVMKDMTGSPVRYMVVAVGILLLIFSSGMMTWKRGAERDAKGAVEKIGLEVSKLKVERDDTDSADKKADIDEKIREIRKDESAAMIEARAESVDAASGNWFLGMVGVLGQLVVCLGLLLIAVTGNNHERLGSLVALGFILTRLG